ncbi:MAG: right-handed parallel beta-helix repeat-containing protein, partial [Thermoplasmata archaeon]
GRKVIAIWLSLIMMVSVVVIVDVSMDISLNVGGTTLYVNTTGSGGAYTKIQDAINDSKDGDTIYVYIGTYYENVVINKRVTLIGENRDNTIIDGSDAGHGFHFVVDEAQVMNFVIDHCKGSDNKAIFIEGSHNNYVRNVNIKNSWFGIYLRDTSGNQIQDCYLFRTWSTSLMMYNTSYTVIRGVTTSSSDFGDGIRLYMSNHNLVENCDSQYHTTGITMATDSSNNTILYNYVYENDFGIDVYWGSSDNVILYNFAERNEYNSISDGDGISTGSDSTGNIIHHNNFKFNYFSTDKQGYDDNGNNLWDDGLEGNWWNDWTSPDGDSNGIVDIPYPLGSAEDRYPLVNQIIQFPPYIPWAKTTPYKGVKDGNLNVSAIVTDDGSISNVHINLTTPSNVSINISMVYDPINRIAYLNNSYNEIGLYNYVIWATDNIGKVTKYEGQFIILQKPIRINSDIDFDLNHGVTGGSGTKGDPWIIQDYEIYGKGYGYCIYIGNTTDYFIVRNCSLYEAGGVWSWPYFTDSGLILYNVQNGRIENNNISYNHYGGTFLSNSNYNILINNTFFTNDEYGTLLYYSDLNSLENNTIKNNVCAISLSSSMDITLYNNSMIENGISIYGNVLEHWNTHSIDTSNKVNTKPITYWKNRTFGTIPAGAGQVILANCTNVFVEAQDISNSTVGISLGFSSNNTISNNTFNSNQYYGIALFVSQDNNISSNTIFENGAGLRLIISDNNTIADNDITLNVLAGAHLDGSNGNLIIANKITINNEFGLRFIDSIYNNITSNYITSNIEYGIYLDTSSNNYIKYNNISYNGWYGIYAWVSSNNKFIANNISNNDEGIRIQSSSDNRIYHNNIIDNTIQAYDDGVNFWNDSYPSGGNYWSDYNGVDNYNGPNQDVPGKDGIGDTNRTIGPFSVDNYPLIGPYPYFPTENYTILNQGWNLISIPIIQQEQNLTEVLASTDGSYNAVQWCDNTDIKDPWKHYKVGKPFGNDLVDINETMSFWIHITNPGDTIFIYNGTQPAENQTITLHPGWNMVGYPSPTSYNRTEGLNNLTFGQEVDLIQWYDTPNQTWHDLVENGYFKLGRGYWIHANVECEWEVPL